MCAGTCWWIWSALEFLFYFSRGGATDVHVLNSGLVMWTYRHRDSFRYTNSLSIFNATRFIEFLYDILAVFWAPSRIPLISSVFPRAVYQVVLSSGLNVYLLSPVRGPGLISLNKEGIFSTFGMSRSLNLILDTYARISHLVWSKLIGATVAGYWGLYMISVHLGYILNSKQTSVVVSTSPAAKNKQEAKVVALRVGVVVGTWILDAFLW